MEKIFGSTPILNLIFLVLAILGIILAVVSINLGRKIKRPVFNTRSFNLINSKQINIPNLTIQVLGKDISTLTLTQVAFWNLGQEVINNSDIAPLSPIKIIPNDENEIISTEIIYTAKATNNFKLIPLTEEPGFLLTFDYIAKNEGLVFNVYHTGLNFTSLTFSGVIKGVNKFEDFNFISTYHTGAILMKLLYKYLGGESSKLWGIILIVILFPVWTFLIFSETLFTKSFKFKLVDKHFYLNE